MSATYCGSMAGRYRTLVRVALVLSYMVLTERGCVNEVNSFDMGPIMWRNILDSRLV